MIGSCSRRRHRGAQTHYNSGGGGYKIGYIRWGIGTGGGGVIPCPTQQMSDPLVPLTVSVWQGYANAVFAYAAFQNPTMIMEGSGYGDPGITDVGAAYADAVASAAVANHAGVGAESLAFNDQFLYAADSPCSNDWCNIFNTYFFEAPIRGLQTVNISDPTCTSNPGRGDPCSLVYVLPFATQRHANVLEIANEDLLCAYASGYSCLVTPPFQPYKAALANAAAGQPNATSTTSGKAAATGTTVLQ